MPTLAGPPTRCHNRYCADLLTARAVLPLCPSCRYIGKWAFAAGAFLIGAIWKVLS